MKYGAQIWSVLDGDKTLQREGGNVTAFHLKNATAELWWARAAERNIEAFKQVGTWKAIDSSHIKEEKKKNKQYKPNFWKVNIAEICFAFLDEVICTLHSYC